MKTLRSKLFLSVGAIFLIIAFLNYLLPELLVRKDLRKAGIYIKENFQKMEQRLLQISSFLITYRFVESAVDLEGASAMIDHARKAEQPETPNSALQLATQIAASQSQTAFVQLQNGSGDFAAISPQDTHLYTPLWAPFAQEMLWIKLSAAGETFVALPADASGEYLLFSLQDLKNVSELKGLDKGLKEKLLFASQHLQEPPSEKFVPFEKRPSPFLATHSVEDLYKTLLADETEWVEKIELIQLLSPWKEKKLPIPVAGFLKIDPSFHHGVCILSREVFLTAPIDITQSPAPSLLLRRDHNTADLDLVRTLKSSNQETWQITLGFSISSIVKNIAQLLQKPILVMKKGSFSLGFTSSGETFDPEATHFPLSQIQDTPSPLFWEGKNYIPYQIDLKLLHLIILTPETEVKAMTQFLETLRQTITRKISLNLAGAALISLAIALLLLENISRKITRPINQLAKAAEQLGKGNYEDIQLPQLKHRQDEVASLSHSFENMVEALRDRDKIRGVLNKVVSKEISEEILKNRIELGGEERTVTMLFSDIRGFTHLSESLNPKSLIGMLNNYMTLMCQIIDETHGVVDKFVGDEIMALYGAPLALENHAVKAIEAALLMIQKLEQFNLEQERQGKNGFKIGIGIHTGLVCAGNMGAENRLNYTVIGSNVNLSARLCAAAQPMQILVSEATWKVPGVQDRFQFKPLPPVSLKGIDHPVAVYEVITSQSS